jgi:hypothetical protein
VVEGLVVEHAFELPCGYVDSEGTLHRRGIMRLATAADEILPLKDARVQNNPAYLIILLLSRVIVRLGGVTQVHPGIVEGLFAEDFTYLHGLYNRINRMTPEILEAECPHCGKTLRVEAPLPGGSQATP